MAENTQDAQEEAKDAVLALIKAGADKVKTHHPSTIGAVARDLAAAYALVTGQAAPDANAVTPKS